MLNKKNPTLGHDYNSDWIYDNCYLESMSRGISYTK